MQLLSLLSATALFAAASVQADNAIELNKSCDKSRAYARIVNRCDYDVHLWSVLKGDGCPEGGMVTLKKGEVYNENYREPVGATGISIKISKTKQCKPNDIVQLEYYWDKHNENEKFRMNYLDVSYVDCLGNDCPTKEEGYYLVAGNQTGTATASAANTWCPILACHDAVSCAKCSYILPDDVQTKTCDLGSSMDFYMCGGEAPTEDYDTTPVVPSPSVESSKSAPTSTKDDSYIAKAAAVTPEPLAPKVKTEIVYVTEYAYVNAKRHGHARRHGNRHA